MLVPEYMAWARAVTFQVCSVPMAGRSRGRARACRSNWAGCSSPCLLRSTRWPGRPGRRRSGQRPGDRRGGDAPCGADQEVAARPRAARHRPSVRQANPKPALKPDAAASSRTARVPPEQRRRRLETLAAAEAACVGGADVDGHVEVGREVDGAAAGAAPMLTPIRAIPASRRKGLPTSAVDESGPAVAGGETPLPLHPTHPFELPAGR